jgi:ribonucleoside-diphosphate reductase beta chain
MRVTVADDVLAGAVIGLTRSEMRQYLEYVAPQRLAMLGLPQLERRVSASQVAVRGEICFEAAF